jgi:hypothetical protein
MYKCDDNYMFYPMQKINLEIYEFQKFIYEIGGTWGVINGLIGLIMIPIFRYLFWNELCKFFLKKELKDD